jgi:hypothetical protein
MNARVGWVMLLVLLAATVAGFASLYRLRLAGGDNFPPYSSRRADPLGTRVLHDSLAEMDGLRVTRRYEPLNDLSALPERTVVLAGVRAGDWRASEQATVEAIERLARAGSRVILALLSEKHEDATGDSKKKKDQKKSSSETTPTPPADKNGTKWRRKENAPAVADLEQRWAVGLATGILKNNARRDEAASAELPASLHWGGDYYFRPAKDSPWKVIYRRDHEAVLIERPLGRGTLVLASDAYLLSNEALQRDRQPVLLSWLLGAHADIEFDESHLGVVEDRGIAALARQYGLGAAMILLVVAAGLFSWHRMALFVPPAPERTEVALRYQQTAGLEALLQRAIAPGELAAACLEEWRHTASAADQVRVNAAIERLPKGASAVLVYNTVRQALRRR